MTTSKPRVMFYSTATYPYQGGCENFWFNAVSEEQFRQNFECHIILGDSDGTRERGKVLQTLGANVYFDASRNPHPDLSSRVSHRLSQMIRRGTEGAYWRNYLQQIKPSLVWFNMAGAGGAPYLKKATDACRSASVPYWLIVQHAFEDLFFETDEQTALASEVLMGAKRVVCISERNRNSIERSIGKHLDNVFMFVNAITHEFCERAQTVSQHHPVQIEGEVRLLNLARFDPTFKGQHILLEALSDAKWRNRDWQLTIQGWGKLRRLLEELVNYYGLSRGSIYIPDFTDDVLASIAASDLLVLPSLSEGTPYALVECMACARPAVGTPVGGIPELIVEGETGWLSHSTKVSDFADALERAWRARGEWKTFGATAQRHVATYYDQRQSIDNLVRALHKDIALPVAV